MKTHHLVTAFFGTLIIALAVWAGLIWGSMQLGRAAYESGDYVDAEEHYSTAERISPLDRWRPDFGQGTALLAQGRIDPGIHKLEEALDTVPEAEAAGGVKAPDSYECIVRANLYLGYAEAGRDEDATAVIETCPNPNPSAAQSDEQEDSDDGEDEGEEGQEPDDSDTGEDGETEQDPQLEELEQRNRDSREQRRDEQEWNSGGGSGQNW